MSKPFAANRLLFGNFTIERVYPQPPARVFGAWGDFEMRSRWFVGPKPWKLVERKLDFRVGGEELCHGLYHGDTIYRARFHEIQQDARIVFVYDMTWSGAHRSTSLANVETLPEGKGTRLIFTEYATFFDGEDGTEPRREGTAFHLETLAEFLDRDELTLNR